MSWTFTIKNDKMNNADIAAKVLNQAADQPYKSAPSSQDLLARGVRVTPASPAAEIDNNDDVEDLRVVNGVVIYNPVNDVSEDQGFLRQNEERSMPEVYGTIPTHHGNNDVPTWRKCMAFVGPGVMVSVGYMDPGNWSTDIAGGSAYGYDLLFIVLLSSLLAMFLQSLSVKVGFATQRDLAQACRDSYSKYVVAVLWVSQEVAIAACDLAEVIGSAVALKLLFGCPLIAGVWVTALDVLILLFTSGSGFRVIEGIVGVLVVLITACFAAQIALSQPNAVEVMRGFLPSSKLFTVPGELFIATGIVGATIMPHNLFLHSSLVLTRHIDGRDVAAVRSAIRYSIIDTVISLFCALFVNASILVVAAATFNKAGYTDIATLEDAYSLLSPILGTKAASTIFAVALLCSGQNSTLTGTLAGQIIMEGFMSWKIRPVYRRMVTRLVAIIPAVIAVSIGGDASINNLLIWSQVILSLALPFAMFPLVHITSDARKMREHVNSRVVTVLAYLAVTVLTMLIIVSFIF